MSGDDVLTDPGDDIGGTLDDYEMPDDGLFQSFTDFRTAVVGIIATWVVKNVFIKPAGLFLWLIDTVAGALSSGLEATVKTSLGTAGASVWNAVLGPGGVIPGIRASLVDVATSAGLAAPIATGLANVLLLAVVAGIIYVFARAAAGYATGGVAS